MSFYMNPKRLAARRTLAQQLAFNLKRALAWPFMALGFKNIEYYYVHGEGGETQLTLGKNVSTADAVFNLSSGNIRVGDNTVFGHDVQVLTGFHRFHEGRLAKLQKNAPKEVPTSGFDIAIGSGCFIGSRAMILKGVTIGDNVIVAAGSIVTKSLPNNVFAAGAPATVIRPNT